MCGCGGKGVWGNWCRSRSFLGGKFFRGRGRGLAIFQEICLSFFVQSFGSAIFGSLGKNFPLVLPVKTEFPVLEENVGAGGGEETTYTTVVVSCPHRIRRNGGLDEGADQILRLAPTCVGVDQKRRAEY